MVHSIKHVLDAFQPFDQFGFRPRMGVEHALIIFETMTEKNSRMGFGSVDGKPGFKKGV